MPTDPTIIAKWFAPGGSWTWYATEYEPEERMFFGYVIGHEGELGYFSRDELESWRGTFALKIERDLSWREEPLSKVKSGAIQ